LDTVTPATTKKVVRIELKETIVTLSCKKARLSDIEVEAGWR
jgi:hypothetical protein